MNNQDVSKYVQYLPRIYHKGSEETYDEYFLGRFLKAFENVLSGSSEEKKDIVGIETLFDNFGQYLNPSQTPPQFLKWLASWVGLDLEETVEFYGAIDKKQKDVSLTQILPIDEARSTVNRDMIGKMVQLYKKRGTTQGFIDFLQLYAGQETTITINEYEEIARVGKQKETTGSAGTDGSTATATLNETAEVEETAESKVTSGKQIIGVNTMVGNASPTFFTVHTMIPIHSRTMLQKKVQLIKRVIENEKPFYTNYNLVVEVPAMRVGQYCRVGKETLVGGMLEE